MSLAIATKLGLVSRQINDSAKKIDNIDLQIYDMTITRFLLKDS